MAELGVLRGLLVLFLICLAIAPLVIWRNTNRTNKLLAQLLLVLGAKDSGLDTSFRAIFGTGKRSRPDWDVRQEEMLHLLRKIAEKRERPAREGERSEVIELKEVATTIKNKN